MTEIERLERDLKIHNTLNIGMEPHLCAFCDAIRDRLTVLTITRQLDRQEVAA